LGELASAYAPRPVKMQGMSTFDAGDHIKVKRLMASLVAPPEVTLEHIDRRSRLLVIVHDIRRFW